VGNPPPVSGLWHQEIKEIAQVVPKLADMTHAFETFNANQGKRTLQRRLQHTKAVVVMMQEIGYQWDLEGLPTQTVRQLDVKEQ